MIVTSSDMVGVIGLPNTAIPTPISMPNLLAWYKASDFDSYGDGQEIAAWNNSGYSPLVNLNVYAQGNSGNRPTVSRYSINNSTMTSIANTGKRGLKSQLGAAYLTSKNTWTWFMVAMFTTRAAENDALGLNVGSSELRLGIDTSGRFSLTYGNVGAFASQGGLSLNDWHYTMVVDTADTEVGYIDGVTASWVSQPGTPSSNPTDLSICEGNTSLQFTGSIAEAGIFDRALSSTEIAQMSTYFQTRYGLT